MLQQALGPPDNEEVNHLRTVVEVGNSTLNNGWDALAAERLNYAGYQASSVVSEIPNENNTLLYDFTLDQDIVKSRELLALFGLSEASLRNEPKGGEVPYRLVLGNDFSPCFAPFKIER
ncbi:MAG: hypothetical protein HC806_05270 [Anaerolineae bacterium]|nr:hypothetical protein [Anaerolineae bacterium]